MGRPCACVAVAMTDRRTQVTNVIRGQIRKFGPGIHSTLCLQTWLDSKRLHSMKEVHCTRLEAVSYSNEK